MNIMGDGGTGTGLPTLVTVKEEKFDFLDENDQIHEPEEKKYEPPKRGRTRSLSKKTAEQRIDMKAKLERSRQSARECRARKKLRYQYLEEVISETEKAIFALRREMETLKIWAKEMDDGKLPENLIQYRTSCVEKKLTNPFKLQSHHHAQIAQQRQEAAAMSAAGSMGSGTNPTNASSSSSSSNVSSPPPANSILGSGGGICGGTGMIQMSTSPSSSLGLGALSLSPTGRMATPYLMSLGRSHRTNNHLHQQQHQQPQHSSGSSVSPP